ncbi:MAG: IS66 family insertion sequence element accessory protein TnpA [Armatimonadota bacterium]
MNPPSELLKSDRQGRVRTPAARRAELLAEYDRSGLSAVHFAQLVGVKPSTFATWLFNRRRKMAAGAEQLAPSSQTSMRFAEVMTPVFASAQVVRVSLPGGAAIELSHTSQVPLAAALLQALS